MESLVDKMRVIKPNWVNEGVGARVVRVIGNEIRNLDPFLMLDFFHVKLPAGFPDHPHRGFQTITYMKQGTIYHEDCFGHKGSIGPHDVQWMTAGKGIIHSEIPASDTQTCIGFQLWLNLQAKNKMIPPQYQEYTSENFPVHSTDARTVRVLGGEFKGLKSPIQLKTKVAYFDIEMKSHCTDQFWVDKAWSTLVFVYKGKVQVNKQLLEENSAGVFQKSSPDHLTIKALEDSKFIFLSGQKIGEKIVQYGPFVMNSRDEIERTIWEYQEGKNGFERKDWQSEIKVLMRDPRRKIVFDK